MTWISKQIKYNYSRRSEKIKYIVIHDTGNKSAGAGAANHFAYFNGGNRDASADFFVDDHEIYCINDYHTYYTWQCGDGGGKYGITNNNSIGIEICINSDGDYNKAFASAVELTRCLMAELNIDANHVVRHYDASRKICPGSMAANAWTKWDEFKRLISTPPVNLEGVSDWARDAVSWAANRGIIKGDENGIRPTEPVTREELCVILKRLF